MPIALSVLMDSSIVGTIINFQLPFTNQSWFIVDVTQVTLHLIVDRTLESLGDKTQLREHTTTIVALTSNLIIEATKSYRRPRFDVKNREEPISKED